MKLKPYLKLLFHAIVVVLIVLSLPVILCLVLCSRVPDWVTIVSALASSSVTIFFGMKYIYFIVWEKDLFEDMLKHVLFF